MAKQCPYCGKPMTLKERKSELIDIANLCGMLYLRLKIQSIKSLERLGSRQRLRSSKLFDLKSKFSSYFFLTIPRFKRAFLDSAVGGLLH